MMYTYFKIVRLQIPTGVKIVMLLLLASIYLRRFLRLTALSLLSYINILYSNRVNGRDSVMLWDITYLKYILLTSTLFGGIYIILKLRQSYQSV